VTILYKLLVGSIGVVLASSFGFCLLILLAVRHYRRSAHPSETKRFPPISILTPLFGTDSGLARNLRSSFRQDYPDFEILLAARSESDPAVAIARQVMLEFPDVPATLLVTGEPLCANAKVHSLSQMTNVAKNDLLVMNDSDIRSSPGMLLTIAAEFADDDVALATCVPRAIPGAGWPSRLEALELNTHFLGGVMVARMLEGMKFALGPSAVVRRRALDGIGGWSPLGDFLAEDFMLGKLIFEAGNDVILSSCQVEHHLGSSTWPENLEHRLRWARSTRRSRP
jgi:ceramide glucosyltransferase